MSEVAAALQLFQALDARTSERFKIVHEDARRDRREVLGKIDAMGKELRELIAAGFASADKQHQECRAGIEALNDRIDAKENQAAGRRSLLKPALELTKEAAPWIACLALGSALGVGVGPALSALSPEPLAAAQAFEQARTRNHVALPPAKPDDGLRLDTLP